MKNTIANRYAQGLFKLAKENSLLDEILKDCENILQIYGESDELQDFLENPKVSKAQKLKVFEEGIKDKVHQFTYDYVSLMIEKGRISHLRVSLDEFIKLSSIAKGFIDVQVTSASDLAPNQIDRLKEQLENTTKKKVDFKSVVDPEIIGGLIIKIGNNVIDGSIKNQISKIRESLLKAQVTEVEVRE